MRHLCFTLICAALAIQGACAHQAGPGRDHCGPPPFGPGGPPVFDSNITLGLQEVLPRVHGHPHGPPPPPDAPRAVTVSRSFEFNDVVTTRKADGSVKTRGVRGTVTVHDVDNISTLAGNVTLLGDAAGSGEHATLVLTGLSGDMPGHCMWPTAGAVMRTNADGSVHHLVFGPDCGKATLDGKTVELPMPPHVGPHGPHPDGRDGPKDCEH